MQDFSKYLTTFLSAAQNEYEDAVDSLPALEQEKLERMVSQSGDNEVMWDNFLDRFRSGVENRMRNEYNDRMATQRRRNRRLSRY